MLRPQLLTPSWRRADQQHPNGNRLPTSRAHPPARKEVESAVSVGTGERIQKILDEGNAIYLGVDPRDCSRILRRSKQASGPLLGKEISTLEANDKEGRIGRIFKKLLCGLSLDCAAKFVLVIGLYLGGHILLTGLGTFVGELAASGPYIRILTRSHSEKERSWGLYDYGSNPPSDMGLLFRGGVPLRDVHNVGEMETFTNGCAFLYHDLDLHHIFRHCRCWDMALLLLRRSSYPYRTLQGKNGACQSPNGFRRTSAGRPNGPYREMYSDGDKTWDGTTRIWYRPCYYGMPLCHRDCVGERIS